ncbi:diphosphomevalonate decarboxylase [Actinocorallia sp. API 0066]|uniref:diphosphomevalonate decarboxylase n=1 Tax=Actinocorallia sp. API 0066 TaxID=2896846 RepID=UPI001E47B8A7|nr:diphosphomevalonate decarboxylase [Actinocorallia sp. API 0066]MCD0448646.1 diphosphomevalonate decarboxylase [Actinocorallia sp. API 0066]
MSTDHRVEQARPSVPVSGRHATAVAHPNIALIKYWGKLDEQLVIPLVDSLSMTLDVFPTTTTVRLGPAIGTDTVTLNGMPAAGEQRRRVIAFLDLVRERAGSTEAADVETRNSVPTGAGLASSASGFAALAVAAAAAYGLDLDRTEMSRLARRGSASASRSLFDGFAICHAGRGSGDAADLSSYAEPVTVPEFDPAMVVAMVDRAPKAVSSRAAMRRTVETSPLYPAWAESSRADLAEIRIALERGDLEAVGEVAERNCLGMHATMLAARPAVRYLSAATLTVLDAVSDLRKSGVPAYATIDAGPNVKILCHRTDAAHVAETIRGSVPGLSTVTAGRGPGARLRPGVGE